MRSRYALTMAVAAILLALVVLRSRRRLRERAARSEPEPHVIEFGIARANAETPADPDDDATPSDGRHDVVIMRGDGGRWIYATIPVAHVGCDNATLLALLFALDARACDRPEGATLAIETAAIGRTVKAEFGDAPVVAGLWLHPNFAKRGLKPHVADVIANRRSLDSAFGAFPRP